MAPKKTNASGGAKRKQDEATSNSQSGKSKEGFSANSSSTASTANSSSAATAAATAAENVAHKCFCHNNGESRCKLCFKSQGKFTPVASSTSAADSTKITTKDEFKILHEDAQKQAQLIACEECRNAVMESIPLVEEVATILDSSKLVVFARSSVTTTATAATGSGGGGGKKTGQSTFKLAPAATAAAQQAGKLPTYLYSLESTSSPTTPAAAHSSKAGKKNKKAESAATATTTTIKDADLFLKAVALLPPPPPPPPPPPAAAAQAHEEAKEITDEAEMEEEKNDWAIMPPLEETPLPVIPVTPEILIRTLSGLIASVPRSPSERAAGRNLLVDLKQSCVEAIARATEEWKLLSVETGAHYVSELLCGEFPQDFFSDNSFQQVYTAAQMRCTSAQIDKLQECMLEAARTLDVLFQQGLLPQIKHKFALGRIPFEILTRALHDAEDILSTAHTQLGSMLLDTLNQHGTQRWYFIYLLNGDLTQPPTAKMQIDAAHFSMQIAHLHYMSKINAILAALLEEIYNQITAMAPLLSQGFELESEAAALAYFEPPALLRDKLEPNSVLCFEGIVRFATRLANKLITPEVVEYFDTVSPTVSFGRHEFITARTMPKPDRITNKHEPWNEMWVGTVHRLTGDMQTLVGQANADLFKLAALFEVSDKLGDRAFFKHAGMRAAVLEVLNLVNFDKTPVSALNKERLEGVVLRPEFEVRNQHGFFSRLLLDGLRAWDDVLEAETMLTSLVKDAKAGSKTVVEWMATVNVLGHGQLRVQAESKYASLLSVAALVRAAHGKQCGQAFGLVGAQRILSRLLCNTVVLVMVERELTKDLLEEERRAKKKKESQEQLQLRAKQERERKEEEARAAKLAEEEAERARREEEERLREEKLAQIEQARRAEAEREQQLRDAEEKRERRHRLEQKKLAQAAQAAQHAAKKSEANRRTEVGKKASVRAAPAPGPAAPAVAAPVPAAAPAAAPVEVELVRWNCLRCTMENVFPKNSKEFKCTMCDWDKDSPCEQQEEQPQQQQEEPETEEAAEEVEAPSPPQQEEHQEPAPPQQQQVEERAFIAAPLPSTQAPIYYNPIAAAAPVPMHHPLMRMPVGLSNETGENSCFLNAALQCLFHVQNVSNEVLLSNHREHCEEADCFQCCLFYTFAHLRAGVDTVTSVPIRNALAKLGFMMGEKADSVEALLVVMEQMNAFFPGLVGCNLVWGVECDQCQADIFAGKFRGSKSAHEFFFHYGMVPRADTPFPVFIHDTSARLLANSGEECATFNEKVAMASTEAFVSCPVCDKPNLEPKRKICFLPRIFVIGLTWSSAAPTREEIKRVLECISPQVDLTAIEGSTVRGLPPRVFGTLRALTCYYGKHCVAFCWSNGTWFMLDDFTVKPLGQHWVACAQHILNCNYQPVSLFYETELALRHEQQCNFFGSRI